MFTLIGRICFVLFIAIMAKKSFSYENDFAVRAGFSYAQSSFNSLEDKSSPTGEEIDREDSRSYGVQTSFSYKWGRILGGLESRILLGNAADLAFNDNNQTITGEGSIRTVDITPFIQFNTKTFKIPGKIQQFFTGINISPWFGYMKFGPSWMIQSIELDKFNVAEEFREDHKLTYESIGFNLAFGIEEDTPYKDMHPVFLEISGAIYESFKVSLVDKSNSQEINILGSRDAKQDIKTFTLVLTIGMILF